MQTNEIQELLLDTIPAWHYWFARPFKRMLHDGALTCTTASSRCAAAAAR